MKQKHWVFTFVMLFSLNMITLYGEQGNNYVTVRSYYPFNETLSYQNIYLYYRFHYNPMENIIINISLVKGCREQGYYPLGYFKDASGGLYEKGSYYIFLKDYFHFKKIIAGNYIPLFGQGLLFGGGFPLIISNPYYDLARFRDGISPTGTVSKTVLLEGIALEYHVSTIYIRPFLSWNSYDCTAGESTYYKYNDNDYDGIPNDEDDDDFTGIGDNFPKNYSCKNSIFSCIGDEPDYENESDRKKRNNLTEYMLGINVSSHWDNLKLGTTLTYAIFNRLIDPYYNFDPNAGDKTGYYFRGKDFISSNLYFKLYNPIELFGEIVGSYYGNLSYYPEFNGGYTSTVGFSGGIRKKIGTVGIIAWGAYLPANLVNPHALKLPDGRNNLLCGLLGFNFSARKRRFSNWIYMYKEIYNKDYPDYPEVGLTYHYKLELPIDKISSFIIQQKYEAIDNYYLAPTLRSYKIASKISIKYPLANVFSLIFSIENRLGKPQDEWLRAGTGISTEAIYRSKDLNTSFQLTYYYTDDDRFAYIYPYDRSFAGWSFMPSSIRGHGITGSLIFIKEFYQYLTLGAKLRYRYDFYNNAYNGVTIYAVSEVSF